MKSNNANKQTNKHDKQEHILPVGLNTFLYTQ